MNVFKNTIMEELLAQIYKINCLVGLQFLLSSYFLAIVYYTSGLPMEFDRFAIMALTGILISLVAEGMGHSIGAVFNVTVSTPQLFSATGAGLDSCASTVGLPRGAGVEWAAYPPGVAWPYSTRPGALRAQPTSELAAWSWPRLRR